MVLVSRHGLAFIGLEPIELELFEKAATVLA
jgi:hypothetical protein